MFHFPAFQGQPFIDLSIASTIQLLLYFPKPYILCWLFCYLPALCPDHPLTRPFHPRPAPLCPDPWDYGFTNIWCCSIYPFILNIGLLSVKLVITPVFQAPYQTVGSYYMYDQTKDSWAPSFEPVLSQIAPAPAIRWIELLKPRAGIYMYSHES